MANEKVVIVTGSGSCIGRAACILLAKAGFNISLVGRTETSLAQTVKMINAESTLLPQSLVISADMSRRDQVELIVDRTLERWGRIDAIVNNAAAFIVQPVSNVDEAKWDNVFATNVFGPAMLTALAWPAFVRQKRGCMVNVSSMATINPFDGLAAYAASKAALESLTRSIANEGRPFGIRSFAIAPGAVETPMLRSAFPESVIPHNRTLDPLDVAKIIFQCIQGKRDTESGTTIVVPSP